ncbi:Box C/D snoRNA accumulation [Elasticomyces elasticus]|uniref:Box C/D snoRNA accumulation n=1 Tax=Elasticomyces elasticus TaxID=574655 RepID=A0AAN8A5E5_9PEZI|nr:Box C/D snoRNA accumulation [Elasticomyces elasticus]
MSALFELCTVCYAEKPKYKCPRCKVQTCSLPCYKKHQQRASCNGQRDPASYLKKSQLATPSGLDQDFNYLKGIERSIDHASETLLKPADGGTHQNLRKVSTGWRPDSRFQNYLTKNSITQERAPKGMQRQRQNTTRSIKNDRVLWTVEWKTLDAGQEVQHDCEGQGRIGDIFRASRTGKKVVPKVYVEPNRQAKRRKLHDEAAEQAQVTGPTEANLVRPDSNDDGQLEHPRPDTAKVEDGCKRQAHPMSSNLKATSDAGATLKHIDIAKLDVKAGSYANPTGSEAATQPQYAELGDGEGENQPRRVLDASTLDIDDHSTPAPAVEGGPEHYRGEAIGDVDQARSDMDINTTPAPRHYYLLRHGASASKILTYFDRKTTLTACLKGQTVQEYPTFFVLTQGPENLPPGFMLYEEYARTVREEHTSLTNSHASNTTQHLGPRDVLDAEGSIDDSAPLDAQSILMMLKRDVRG